MKCKARCDACECLRWKHKLWGLTTLQTKRTGRQVYTGSHAGGWDTISRGGYTSTGAHFPDDCVGHLGYTGTSLWMSPSEQVVVALLTNRGHPTDELAHIRAARPRLHDAVARFVGWA